MSVHRQVELCALVALRIFTLLMNALRLDAEEREVERESLLAVVLQLSLLFETFIISSCPQLPRDGGERTLAPSLTHPTPSLTHPTSSMFHPT